MLRLLASAAAVSMISAAAYAADLPLPEEPIPEAVVAPLYDWTGFYVGVHAGYGFGETDVDTTHLPSQAAFGADPFSQSADVDGFLGGGQLGANWQMGRFVVGAEGDISWSDMDGSSTFGELPVFGGGTDAGSSQTISAEIDWLATARLRVGLTPAERLLLYVTGGAAFADVNYDVVTDYVGDPFRYPGSFSDIEIGWTAGAGFEWALWNRWSLKGEALYFDLGEETITADPVAANPPFQVVTDHDLTGVIGRVGLNFAFGAPPP